MQLCLDALKRQSYPPELLEIIVVDDESTDDTAHLVESIAESWNQDPTAPGLRLIRQSWRGAGAARNRGAQVASGSVLLFTDADCEPTVDWVSEMMLPFQDPDVAVVAGGYLTRQESPIAKLAQAEFEERYRFVSKHHYIDIAFTHSAAFRKELFITAGGFDERMPNNADDLELSYRIAMAGHRIVFAPKGLVYHQHPAAIWDYLRKKFGRGYWRTVVFKQYPGKLVRDSYTPFLLKFQILLAGAAGAILAMSIFGFDRLLPLAVTLLLILLATGLPFAFRLRGSALIKFMAPFFLAAHAFAIGTGVLFGAFDNIEHYETGGRRH